MDFFSTPNTACSSSVSDHDLKFFLFPRFYSACCATFGVQQSPFHLSLRGTVFLRWRLLGPIHSPFQKRILGGALGRLSPLFPLFSFPVHPSPPRPYDRFPWEFTLLFSVLPQGGFGPGAFDTPLPPVTSFCKLLYPCARVRTFPGTVSSSSYACCFELYHAVIGLARFFIDPEHPPAPNRFHALPSAPHRGPSRKSPAFNHPPLLFIKFTLHLSVMLSPESF